jgi:hypothetical protein
MDTNISFQARIFPARSVTRRPSAVEFRIEERSPVEVPGAAALVSSPSSARVGIGPLGPFQTGGCGRARTGFLSRLEKLPEKLCPDGNSIGA